MPNSGHGGPPGTRVMTIFMLSNAVRIMSGDLFFTRVMTIFINVTILDIYTYRYAKGSFRYLPAKEIQ